MFIGAPAHSVKTPSTQKIRLFGIPVDNLTMGETVDRIDKMVGDGKIHQHVVINVDKIVKM